MTRPEQLSAALDLLARNLDGPYPGFKSFAEPIQNLIGPCYFAVSLMEPQTKLRRIFSNREKLYPVDSVKSMAGTGWEAALVFERRHLFSPDAAALHVAFQDASAILDHGFGCAINLRMALNGVLLGSVNLLAKPKAFNLETFNLAQAFVGPLALMTALQIDKRGNDK